MIKTIASTTVARRISRQRTENRTKGVAPPTSMRLSVRQTRIKFRQGVRSAWCTGTMRFGISQSGGR
jgi:hypothetical protein